MPSVDSACVDPAADEVKLGGTEQPSLPRSQVAPTLAPRLAPQLAPLSAQKCAPPACATLPSYTSAAAGETKAANTGGTRAAPRSSRRHGTPGDGCRSPNDALDCDSCLPSTDAEMRSASVVGYEFKNRPVAEKNYLEYQNYTETESHHTPPPPTQAAKSDPALCGGRVVSRLEVRACELIFHLPTS